MLTPYRGTGQALRGKWVLKGERASPGGLDQPALGRKGQLLLGGVPGNRRGGMDGTGMGNSNSATSATFLRQLREQHAGPLTVIWDNSPAHRGDALRAYLATPGLRLRLW